PSGLKQTHAALRVWPSKSRMCLPVSEFHRRTCPSSPPDAINFSLGAYATDQTRLRCASMIRMFAPVSGFIRVTAPLALAVTRRLPSGEKLKEKTFPWRERRANFSLPSFAFQASSSPLLLPPAIVLPSREMAMALLMPVLFQRLISLPVAISKRRNV